MLAAINRSKNFIGPPALKSMGLKSTMTLRLEPAHALTLYHRGLLHNDLSDFHAALADFDLALRNQSHPVSKATPEDELSVRRSTRRSCIISRPFAWPRKTVLPASPAPT